MKFTQDAGKDLDIFCKAFAAGKEQIGLARFGDGEERIYMGGTYHCSDGWVSRPSESSALRKRLGDSIRFSHPNYYVGFRHPRNLKLYCWAVKNVKTPPSRMFDPCLFVNSRWSKARKFFSKVRKNCFLVGSGEGVNYRIPANCIEPEYNWKKLLDKLLTVKKPILLAAGPLANVLVMEYLERGGKQSIIDIGTVLDYEMFGKSTRRYMRIAMKKIKSKKSKRDKKKRPPRKKVKRRKPTKPPDKRKRVGRRPMGAVRAEAHLKKKRERGRNKK